MVKGFAPVRAISLALFFSAALALAPCRAHAMHPDARAVVTGGLYGMGAGLAIGLVMIPFSQNPSRSVFVSVSVGLYLGIAVGVYYAIYRDDPSNPLRKRPEDARQDSGDAPGYSVAWDSPAGPSLVPIETPGTALLAGLAPDNRGALQFAWPVLRF